MFSSKFLLLLLALFFVQGLCKPSKYDGLPEDDYNGDDPTDYDEESEQDDDDTASNDEPPEIKTRPKHLTIPIGSLAVLPCVVINSENYAVFWRKSGSSEYIFDDPQKRVTVKENNTLFIKNVGIADAGNYTCEVLVKDNPIQITHRLDVLSSIVPPTTHSPPSSSITQVAVYPGERVQVRQGEAVRLGCSVNISPRPEIKWFRKNSRIGDIGDEDTTIDGDYLVIRKVNRHHSGPYQCLVENGERTPPRGAINLIVHYSPEIETSRDPIHTGIDQESVLKCNVHAHPQATVKWYKDGKEILAKKNKIQMSHDKHEHFLRILNTVQHDLGQYVCEATNDLGTDKKIIELTGAPSRPVYKDAEMKDDGTTVITWRLESFKPIEESRVQFRLKGKDSWTHETPNTIQEVEPNQYVGKWAIHALHPGTYEVVFMTRNSYGWSPASVSHQFQGEERVEKSESVTGGSSSISVPSFAMLTTLLLVVLPRAFNRL